RQSPNQRAARDLYEQVFAGVAVHPFAHAVLAFLGNEPRLIILGDEVVQVVVGLQNHVAPAPAVAAGRAALGPGRFTEEGDAAFPAVSGARENFDFVDEHSCWSSTFRLDGSLPVPQAKA